MNPLLARPAQALVACALCTPVLSAQSTILCIGDSITEARPNHPGYRLPLWASLRSAGYCVDFVGTKRGVAKSPPGNLTQVNLDAGQGTADLDHYAWSGKRSGEVRALLATVTNPGPELQADVALIHLGTNDVILDVAFAGPEVVAAIVDLNLRAIIAQLHSPAFNPNMKICVAKIIPLDPLLGVFFDLAVTLINEKIDALGAGMPDVIAVDHFSGFDHTTMTFDGVHPDATGASFMANRWHAALLGLLPPPGAQDPCFREYGRGCAGATGSEARLWTGAQPKAGTTLPLSLTGFGPTVPVLGWVGFSSTTAGPLPPDCFGFVGAPTVVAAGGSNPFGRLTWNFSLQPYPIGMSVFVQAVATTPTLTVTNGAEVTVGM